MIRFVFITFFFLSTLFSSTTNNKNVSVQLLWLNQFEFAGFYIAKEKGYYEEFGLDVEIKEYQFGMNVVDEVVLGKSTFAVGDSTIIVDRAEGKDVVALSALYQHSPLVLLAMKDSGITTAKDLRNKRVMASSSESNNASVLTMLLSQGVRQDEVSFIEHTFNIDDLINGKTDLMTAYLSNQPFILKEKGHEGVVINPKDYGFDFYADLLFTNKETVHQDPGLVENFRLATLRGYSYAFNNIEEVIDLILLKYNTQNKSKEALLYEANILKDLAFSSKITFGDIDKKKIYKIASSYQVLGLIKSEYELDGFVYTPLGEDSREVHLTREEKFWLKNNPILKLGIDNNWAPFEFIDKNGAYKGIASDYLKIVENKLGITFKIDNSLSWNDTLKAAQAKELDVLSCLVKTTIREEYLNFTEPYLDFPMVIVTSDNISYIKSVENLFGKKVVVIRGYAPDEILTENYPNFKLTKVDTLEDALEMVASGDAYAFIGNVASASYTIKQKGLSNLKVSGITPYSYKLSIGIREDLPILRNILEKALASISVEEKEAIYNKWINLTYEVEFDYSKFWKIVGAILALVLLVAYWNRKLASEVRKRREAEEMIKELNVELEHKIEKAVQEIEYQNKIIVKQSQQAAMGELISVIAHQLKQPLNSIALRVQSLEDLYEDNELDQKNVENFVDDNMDKITFMGKTIDDFRNFFRPDKKKKQFKISESIEKVESLLKSQLIKHNIELIIDTERDIIINNYDTELQHVIMNIVNNAKDALGEMLIEKPKIWITLKQENLKAIITIEDNAGGIPDSIKEKIFDSYFTTKGENGTGIGLHLSKMIVEDNMGGRLEIENSHRGACFKIVLHIK